MLQLTSRDEALLDWMNVVRLTDVEAIRWALAAYQDDREGASVSVRRANHWIARMAELGYLGRARPMYRDRQIVWPTHQASGRVAPRLFRQTMRHELAVAMVAGRYLAHGFQWSRDRWPESGDHQADGVATRAGIVNLIEVELMPKTRSRYRAIFASHVSRIRSGEVSDVTYACAVEVAAVISREADLFIFRDQRCKVTETTVFDAQGRWLAGSDFQVDHMVAK